MSLDARAVRSLIEESGDLDSEAIRTTRSGLADLVEEGMDRRAAGGFDPDETRAYHIERRRLLANSVKALAAFAGTAFGVGLHQMFTDAAAADTTMDVQAGQTAASIENLTIAVYNKAAGLAIMRSIPSPAGATVTAFMTQTIMQHTMHAQAFNAAVRALGGKEQAGIDKTVYDTVVAPTLPTLTSPLKVVQFAASLETVAAQTYAAETAAVSDRMLRNTFASILGVEAQHAAVLTAMAALLEGNAPQLITIPPPGDQLPAAAGSVGIPHSFLGLDKARPATEGAA